jgi:ribosomal-protein-alanine N-acetyltransferase
LPSQNTSIRLIDAQDAVAIAAHRARDVETFARWEPSQPASFYTPGGQSDRIERMLEGRRAGSTWPGVVLADDVVIGQVTVGTILREPFLRGSVGYWIASDFQNQGHAGRAVSLVLRIMTEELGLHRADASTQLENLPSQRVLRKNGFTPFGIAHSNIFLAGEWRDGLLWENILEH